MSRSLLRAVLAGAAALAVVELARAAGADLGQAEKQPTNWTAIGMFAAFVVGTLFITKWAARRTKSAADFVFAAAHLVMNSVPTTKTANMPIAVQLVGCFSAWPRSAPAAIAAAQVPRSAIVARDLASIRALTSAPPWRSARSARRIRCSRGARRGR